MEPRSRSRSRGNSGEKQSPGDSGAASQVSPDAHGNSIAHDSQGNASSGDSGVRLPRPGLSGNASPGDSGVRSPSHDSRRNSSRGNSSPGDSGACSPASHDDCVSPCTPRSEASTIPYHPDSCAAADREETSHPDTPLLPTKDNAAAHESDNESFNDAQTWKRDRSTSGDKPPAKFQCIEVDTEDEDEDEVDEGKWKQWLAEIRAEEDLDYSQSLSSLGEGGSPRHHHVTAGCLGQESRPSNSSFPTSLGQASFAVGGSLARCHSDIGASMDDGDFLVYYVGPDGTSRTPESHKAKDNVALTREEVMRNKTEIDKQKMEELKGLIDLQCFKRIPRRQARNIVDARWVITLKNKPEGRQVKCRITMRGFKDRAESLETFAGTASRAGQRIVNTVIAQHADWTLFSIDI